MQTDVGAHIQSHIQIHAFKSTHKHRNGPSSSVAELTPSERRYLSFWNVLESTWAAGLCAADSDLGPPKPGKCNVDLFRRYWSPTPNTHKPSHTSPPSPSCICLFIQSVAVWNSGAREGAGWGWRGWRAVVPWLWLWRRSRRGAEGASQEPQLESCWSGSTCSRASSLHRCLLSGHKRRKRENKHCHSLMYYRPAQSGGIHRELMGGKMNK